MATTSDHPIGQGEAASPGQAEGPARFVTIEYPSDEADPPVVDGHEAVGRGDVLITEELRSPTIAAARRAAAIVTIARNEADKQRALTSKGAVAARQLEIPAVTACNDIRPYIRAGATIRVDGDAGLVYLVG